MDLVLRRSSQLSLAIFFSKPNSTVAAHQKNKIKKIFEKKKIIKTKKKRSTYTMPNYCNDYHDKLI